MDTIPTTDAEVETAIRQLTKTQRKAYDALQREGKQWPIMRTGSTYRYERQCSYTRHTLNALVLSGLARWVETPNLIPHVALITTPDVKPATPPAGYRWAREDELDRDDVIMVPLTVSSNGHRYTGNEADAAVPIMTPHAADCQECGPALQHVHEYAPPGSPLPGEDVAPTPVLERMDVEISTAQDGTEVHTVKHPHGRHVVAVDHDQARVSIYWHTPDGGGAAYLVVDVDSESDEPDLRVYVNDAPVAGFGAGGES